MEKHVIILQKKLPSSAQRKVQTYLQEMEKSVKLKWRLCFDSLIRLKTEIITLLRKLSNFHNPRSVFILQA